MNTYKIPFNRPTLVGTEINCIQDAINGGQISGDGPYTKKCEALLDKELGVPRVLLTTSCTHALEMAALLLELAPGDEVILPSFTFVSTANAFVRNGARIVFADIRPDTLNLDETLLESLITPRTRAIVPVHYAGVACEMDPVMSIAQRHGLTVIEDNANSLFSRYRGRYTGTFGQMAAQSFHETKNITCGEGGALLVNDPQLLEWLSCCATWAQTAIGFCVERSTSTPGSTPGQATWAVICSRRFSMHSWKREHRSRALASGSGSAISKALKPGRSATACDCR